MNIVRINSDSCQPPDTYPLHRTIRYPHCVDVSWLESNRYGRSKWHEGPVRNSTCAAVDCRCDDDL
ncbi:hypothetical protein ANCCAN_28602 [Ancylostoma caninum]|uniref:Uncharacterized protein n=1 Tax=Ancylostoma caninum TaxID=29170 RepID=A0A368F0S8_ANCCA|nr:hypothetical protein ANCCAN_28602 [Ancylostoma caninum]